MKEYLLSLLLSSVAVAMLTVLLPKKESENKSYAFATSLFLLCVLLSPLRGSVKLSADSLKEFLEGLEYDTAEQERLSAEQFDALSSAYLEEKLCEKLAQIHGLSPENLRAQIKWENGEATSVFLFLSGKAIWKDSAKLEATVKELLNLPCTCILE